MNPTPSQTDTLGDSSPPPSPPESLSPPNTSATEELFSWRRDGFPYHSYNHFLKQKFGGRVQKVSVDGGYTCPNVDGKVATGGCVFCDNRSFSPSRRIPRLDILGQLEDGMRRLKRRYEGVERFLAYFQPGTNTYGPIDKLKKQWYQALEHPQVVGLVIGTRPDCVPDEILDLIGEVAQKTFVSVEYGLQTMHDRSLDWMNRGHHHDAFLDAVARSKNRGFEICAHVILGVPGESHQDMMATAREVARLEIDSVKVHNLYAVKGTPLGEDVLSGKIQLMERDDFARTVVDFLELIPPQYLVERISGDAPPDYLIGPAWCLDKPGLLAAVLAEFRRRETYQGRLA